MLLKVFSIRDTAAEAYNQPFFMLTQAEAIRIFTNMANDPESNISKHSSDYHLYYLGTYDNQTGYFSQDKEILNIGRADSFKKERQAAIDEDKEMYA